MTIALLNKLTGVKDLRRILETTVKEVGESLSAESCQIMLSNPLDPNVTSICEYKSPAEEADVKATFSMPLVLHGLSFGSISVARRDRVNESEINSLRLVVGELGNIIRQAQISDIVQRDTFRDTFLVEIGNVMAYSLGIGDALFMVVNILGKALQASRCLFICTDDNQAGWKCYEFWQQDRVKSCQEYRWPTSDSPVVAQTLLAKAPLVIFEGRQTSYAAPVQEELDLIGVRSLLGIALKSSEAIHGCVILQQCDYRRAWTRKEVDMVQSVADKVAEALVKLPAEKRAREPIMQLHQRIVSTRPGDQQKFSMESLRTALKGALGQQAIPSARTSAQTLAKEKRQAQPIKPAAVAPPPALQPGDILKAVFDLDAKTATVPAPDSTIAAPPKEKLDFTPSAPAPAGTSQAAEIKVDQDKGAQVPSDAYAVLDLGDYVEAPGTNALALSEAQTAAKDAVAKQEAMPTAEQGTKPVEALDAKEQAQGIEAGPWGNLDAIPTPSSGPAKAGLSASMLHKSKSVSSTSALLASFYKDKSASAAPVKESQPEFVEGPPIQINEAEAKEKLDRLLSSSNPTTDYIFATPGLDPRMLGRIDSWITEIEQKDKYVNGHARQVAEYSLAIGHALGLTEKELSSLRQAALVHDVGKLGTASQILQKRDEDLSDPELITIMKHPLDGAELLASFPDLSHLTEIVQAHHEEFDGNGYPQGLKGEEIPLAARIIFLANAYYSMVSEMCYGPGMSPEQAEAELKAGSGNQFDPTLVQVFLDQLAQEKQGA
jgi:HD-GYP domain-containing protein (c-di-GMP phosphodiesterase class II)/GAF domain-containing protein